ncbi:MAG: heme o synthase [Candidatus Saccharimonadales bacterium]
MAKLKVYYELTKPGRIYANAMTAAAGFLLAAKWQINFGLLTALLVGISLIIASANTYNNVIDRDLDQKMARTKHRALVKGDVPAASAIIYASLMLAAGFLLLAFFTNWLVVLVGAIGFIDYVILYGIAKRRTVHGTLVGCVSGAVSIVAGYVAVRGRFDSGALLLFLIMVLWQMPHSYAIGIYAQTDYAAAGIPVMPVKYGARVTKIQMAIYSAAFVIAALFLTGLGDSGFIYFIIMALVGLTWFYINLNGFRAINNEAWAKKSFLFSLAIIPIFSLMLIIGPVIP